MNWTRGQYPAAPPKGKDEAAYLAGIIDGEGTITLTKNNSRDIHRRIILSVSNTDKILLEYIQKVWGGKLLTRNSRNVKHSVSYVWQLDSQKAKLVIEQIAPFLRTYKRHRAELILNQYDAVTKRNGKYSEEELEAKKQFEDAFFLMGPK